MANTGLVTTESTLREQVFALSHRWYLPVLAFLLGSLAGWLVAFVLPTPYRAQALLSVAFNGDFYPRNPDDYKNWQLDQLNMLAVAPDVITDTLTLLQQQDAYWNSVSPEALRAMLSVSWRNAGEWRLQAENTRPDQAVLAVETWQAVFLKKYEQAHTRSFELVSMDKQLTGIRADLVQSHRRFDDVTRAIEALDTLRASGSQLPAGQPVDGLTYWNWWSIAARSAGFDPAWQAALDSFPPQPATLESFLSWADGFQALLNSEASYQQNQISSLEYQGNEMWLKYQDLSAESRNLTYNLGMEKAVNPDPAARPIRPASLLALVGGVLGIVAWGFIGLARATSKAVHA